MNQADWPTLTNLSPRIPGRLKVELADFQVEELPAYLPAGEGEHLYLWIEKHDLPAEQLLKHIARQLDVPSGDIGCAGLKDRRAITRQWISVPARAAERVPQIESPQVRVLDQCRHGNKLRTGHLRGNRFQILVRHLPETDVAQPREAVDSAELAAGTLPLEPAALTTALETLRRRGFANYFGDQRFGREGETLQLGLDLLAQRKSPRDIPYSRRRFLLKLALSAVQSHLFNLTLADRIRQQSATTVLVGDVLQVVASGGVFVSESPLDEQQRLDAGEIVVTGPMFGPKMKSPQAAVAAREAAILAENGLTPEAFQGFKDLLPGTRRPYLICPENLSCQVTDAGWLLQFELPAGVYATTLLNELFELRQDTFPTRTDLTPALSEAPPEEKTAENSVETGDESL